MIHRQKAMELIKKYNKNQQNINHFIETEAIMKSLARKFSENEEYWGMLGLLHDIDWELVKDNVKEHTIKTSEILRENGFDDEFINIIQSHCYGFDEVPSLKDKSRTKNVEFALAAAETITGLIYAYALMRGGLEGMKASSLKKKFKDKSFAAKCNREIIQEIKNTGLELIEFFEISIKAMQSIAKEIGF